MAIEVTATFNPVLFSLEENKFLLAHLGEPPQIALRAITSQRLPEPSRDTKTGKVIDKNPNHYPDGVIPAAVEPALRRVYELEEDKKHTGTEWVGIEAVKASIRVYLEQAEKWQKDKLRGAPRFPSMHSFDTRNRPHRGGPGSDSGQVSTYFDQQGNRKPFTIHLFGDGAENVWQPEWAKTGQKGTDLPAHKSGLLVNAEQRRFECFCGHTEHFKAESRSSYNSARARMAKHLMKATDEVERHRDIHTSEFGSS